MAKESGKKRCYRGKSCGSTCISKGFLCIMELGPELAAMLKEVRGLWSAKGGDLGHRDVSRIEKLYKAYQKMPDGPAKERVKQRIQHIQNTRLGKSYRDRAVNRVRDKHDPERYMREIYEREKLAREAAAEKGRIKRVESDLDNSKSMQDRLNKYRR